MYSAAAAAAAEEEQALSARAQVGSGFVG